MVGCRNNTGVSASLFMRLFFLFLCCSRRGVGLISTSPIAAGGPARRAEPDSKRAPATCTSVGDRWSLFPCCCLYLFQCLWSVVRLEAVVTVAVVSKFWLSEGDGSRSSQEF